MIQNSKFEQWAPSYGLINYCAKFHQNFQKARTPYIQFFKNLKIDVDFFHRKHPQITYRLPTYGHKAPMSRTVTLTEPYNPYNKITKEELVL